MGRRAFLIFVFLLSCGPKFDENKAREEIASLIANQYQEWFKLTEGSEGSDSTVIDTIPKIARGDTTLERWWRKTDTLGTIVGFSFDSDTIAHVTVYTDLRGTFNYSLRRDTVFYNNKKYLIDLSTRQALFRRDAVADSWRLTEISWAELVSDTVVHPTVNIRKVELNGTAYPDTTLDHLWPLTEIISFKPAESVSVKLTTYEDTSSAVAVLYGQCRKRFLPDGKDKNTWQAGFITPAAPGRYRLVLGLVNRTTFFDSSYPYDANSWVIDYEVK
jgi:hypothetical protein